MVSPSPESRESMTRVSRCLQNGQRIAKPAQSAPAAQPRARANLVQEAGMASEGSALVSLDIVHYVLDGADFLGVFIRDLNVELLFKRHHQFDDIERVSAEVLDERRIGFHFVGGYTELLADFLANLGFDV